MTEAFVETTFRGAHEVFSRLGIGGELRPRTEYLFRGVSSATFDLVPKALRKGALVDYLTRTQGRVPNPPRSASPIQQIQEMEKAAVMQFCDHALKSRLVLPEDSQFYRSQRLRDKLIDTNNPGAFPPHIDRSLYALAQHYGVPTSLLDWTYDPFMAAYFAVSTRRLDDLRQLQAGKELDKSPLAIWALNTRTARQFFHRGDYFVEVVSAPHGVNSNMSSQDGVFTVLQWTLTDVTEHPPALNKLVEGRKWGGSDPVLTKLILPIQEAFQTYFRLIQGGYDAARVYPGFGSVTEALEERYVMPWRFDPE